MKMIHGLVVIALILPIAIEKLSILAKQLKRNMKQTELIYFHSHFSLSTKRCGSSAHMRIGLDKLAA
jgi:uncharacterized membrane protein